MISLTSFLHQRLPDCMLTIQNCIMQKNQARIAATYRKHYLTLTIPVSNPMLTSTSLSAKSWQYLAEKAWLNQSTISAQQNWCVWIVEVDLGVTWVTSKLSWNQHITLTISKANKMLRVLRRTCPLLMNRNARRTLYLSLVKSQMCYATEIWSPSQSTFKINIERIQTDRLLDWFFK